MFRSDRIGPGLFESCALLLATPAPGGEQPAENFTKKLRPSWLLERALFHAISRSRPVFRNVQALAKYSYDNGMTK